MVALEEVGDFSLADLWVSNVSIRGGTAHLEVEQLCVALFGTSEGVQQLLKGGIGVKGLHFSFNY